MLAKTLMEAHFVKDPGVETANVVWRKILHFFGVGIMCDSLLHSLSPTQFLSSSNFSEWIRNSVEISISDHVTVKCIVREQNNN